MLDDVPPNGLPLTVVVGRDVDFGGSTNRLMKLLLDASLVRMDHENFGETATGVNDFMEVLTRHFWKSTPVPSCRNNVPLPRLVGMEQLAYSRALRRRLDDE